MFLGNLNYKQISLMLKSYKIIGLPVPFFIILSGIILAATYLGVIPHGIIGALPLMIILGTILNETGNHTPIIKDFLGGGPILIIYGLAVLVFYGILPASSVEIVTSFIKKEGFLSFYISALIAGSILGMDRKLLVSIAFRYIPVILGGVATALVLTAFVGFLMSYGAKDAIFYISFPMMGGGMGAGAVPFAEILSKSLQTDQANILSRIVPALALGNTMAIIMGGVLNRLSKTFPKFSGNGLLLKNQIEKTKKEDNKKPIEVNYHTIGTGLLLSTTFFIWGKILGQVVPIHPYALMIISVVIIKVLGLLPKNFEDSAYHWYQFVVINLTPALLVGIGVAYTKVDQVLGVLSIQYVILVSTTILGVTIGTGFFGALFGFYPMEAAVTAGLCMTNMGGTGDVAVLSAAGRMRLMPFAQISTRLGGAFMLTMATIIVKFSH